MRNLFPGVWTAFYRQETNRRFGGWELSELTLWGMIWKPQDNWLFQNRTRHCFFEFVTCYYMPCVFFRYGAYFCEVAQRAVWRYFIPRTLLFLAERNKDRRCYLLLDIWNDGALGYKLEGRRFKSRVRWIFSIHLILADALWGRLSL
jgi:hypothetical protein